MWLHQLNADFWCTQHLPQCLKKRSNPILTYLTCWSSSIEITRRRTARQVMRWWAIRTASARGRSMIARSWDTQSNHRRRERPLVPREKLCSFGTSLSGGIRCKWPNQRNRRCVNVIETGCCLVCCRIVLFRTWWYHLTFSSRRRQLMSKAFNRLQSRMVRFHVSEPYSNTEETRERYILSFVCREMQRRFHRALESLFMAPAALPSAETIEPRYVNEGTNSTSSPSMFIGVVIAEEGEIIMALVLVQLIDIPTLAASLLKMRNTDDRSSEEGENSAMSSA